MYKRQKLSHHCSKARIDAFGNSLLEEFPILPLKKGEWFKKNQYSCKKKQKVKPDFDSASVQKQEVKQECDCVHQQDQKLETENYFQYQHHHDQLQPLLNLDRSSDTDLSYWNNIVDNIVDNALAKI